MSPQGKYQNYIVKYRKVILETLHNTTLTHEGSAAHGSPLNTDISINLYKDKLEIASQGKVSTSLNSVPGEGPLYCEIDVQSAEKLPGGSLMFPLWKRDADSGWCILAMNEAKKDQINDEYTIVGRIEGQAIGPEFLSLAYKYLLNRTLKHKDLQSDWLLVESQRLTRREVLKRFLESGDAGLGNRQFLMVPDPSPWLDQIEGVLSK